MFLMGFDVLLMGQWDVYVVDVPNSHCLVDFYKGVG